MSWCVSQSLHAPYEIHHTSDKMTNMNDQRKEPIATCWPVAVAWMCLAAVLRLVPHPQNFAAMGALSLYAGARMPWHVALLAPIAVMACTDLCLWYTLQYQPFNPYVYSCYFATALVGLLLRRTNSVWKIGVAAIACDLLFFLVTNGVVWAKGHGNLYDTSIAGLFQSYTAALPFHQNTVISTLIFVPLFFVGHALAVRRVHEPVGERIG